VAGAAKQQAIISAPRSSAAKERDRNEALDICVYLLACVDILEPKKTR